MFLHVDGILLPQHIIKGFGKMKRGLVFEEVGVLVLGISCQQLRTIFIFLKKNLCFALPSDFIIVIFYYNCHYLGSWELHPVLASGAVQMWEGSSLWSELLLLSMKISGWAMAYGAAGRGCSLAPSVEQEMMLQCNRSIAAAWHSFWQEFTPLKTTSDSPFTVWGVSPAPVCEPH